jgi:SAM-dependent methyltransferase
LKFLRKYTNVNDTNSLSNKFRRKRFYLFNQLIKKHKSPVKIIDLGGTQEFWENMGLVSDNVDVTIINVDTITVRYPNFRFIQMDVKNLNVFKDKEFDIVFSNSLIEHVGDFSEKKQIANQILRIGESIFIQTPNYYFPLEPHFLVPFFQFFPSTIKVWLLQHFNLGWYNKFEKKEAEKIVKDTNLLGYKDVKLLFPDAVIIKEKYLGFTKSFICVSN